MFSLANTHLLIWSKRYCVYKLPFICTKKSFCKITLSSRVVDDLDRTKQENQRRFTRILTVRHSMVSNNEAGKRNNYYKSIKRTDLKFPQKLLRGDVCSGLLKYIVFTCAECSVVYFTIQRIFWFETKDTNVLFHLFGVGSVTDIINLIRGHILHKS